MVVIHIRVVCVYSLSERKYAHFTRYENIRYTHITTLKALSEEYIMNSKHKAVIKSVNVLAFCVFSRSVLKISHLHLRYLSLTLCACMQTICDSLWSSL